MGKVVDNDITAPVTGADWIKLTKEHALWKPAIIHSANMPKPTTSSLSNITVYVERHTESCSQLFDVMWSSHCRRRVTPAITRIHWRWNVVSWRTSAAFSVHTSEPYSRADKTTAMYTLRRQRRNKLTFSKTAARRLPNASYAFAIRAATSWDDKPSRCMTLLRYVKLSTEDISPEDIGTGSFRGLLMDMPFIFVTLIVTPEQQHKIQSTRPTSH